MNMVHNLVPFDRRMQSMPMKCIDIIEVQFCVQNLRAVLLQGG